MSLPRQLVAALLCMVLVLALPAFCLHALAMPPASTAHSSCDAMTTGPMTHAGMTMPASEDSAPRLPHACCNPHEPLPALAASTHPASGLAITRLPLLLHLHALPPASNTLNASPRTASTPPLTPLRI